jgi:hypothetical protein
MQIPLQEGIQLLRTFTGGMDDTGELDGAVTTYYFESSL